jgi:hypothetical protein
MEASGLRKVLNGLFSPSDIVTQDNETIVAAFRNRLRKVAGFEYVPDALPMRNSNNAVVHYRFFASQKPVANDIIEDCERIVCEPAGCIRDDAWDPMIHIVHDDDFIRDSRPDRLLRNIPYVDYLNFRA